MVNNKERQNYYDKTELVSRLLREILRRVSRVLSFVSVSRNPRQAIRNLNSFNNYFLFSSHCCCCCCCCCSIFGVLFIFWFNLNYCLYWLSFPGWRNDKNAKGELHFLVVHPMTGHEDPEGEYRCSYSLSLTSTLDGVHILRHDPAALPPGKTRYPLYRRLGVPQGRSWRVRSISPPPGLYSRTFQSVASRYTDWTIPAHDTFPYSKPISCARYHNDIIVRYVQVFKVTNEMFRYLRLSVSIQF